MTSAGNALDLPTTQTPESTAGVDAWLVASPNELSAPAERGARPESEIAKTLAMAQLAADGDHDRAIAWLQTERLSEFDNRTPAQLMEDGKLQVVLDYIESIAGCPTG